MSDADEKNTKTFMDCHKQELYDLEQIKKHMSSAILHDMVGVKGYITWGDYRFDIVLHSKLGTPESSA